MAGPRSSIPASTPGANPVSGVHAVRAGRSADETGLRFDIFATRVLYVVTFGLGAISSVQPDLWWLLRAGKDIWNTRRVSLVERYSHTASGRFWPNHEWLWEVGAFAIQRVGGMPLLSASVGITVVATVWVMRRVTRARGYVVPLVLTVALPLMSISWTARPQVTSMLFFAITMLLLARERYLWIPPLFFLWANVHAQVVMGGALLATALGAAVIDHLQKRSEPSRDRLRRVTVTVAVSAGATLVTPLGPRLWAYVLNADARPGQAQIIEWASAVDLLKSPVALWSALALTFWCILFLAAAMSIRRYARLATWEARVPLMASVAMAPLAILAVRNIPFFLVAAAPLLMTLLEFGNRGAIGSVRRWREALIASGLLVAGLLCLTWIVAPPTLGWRPVSSGLAGALRDCPGPLYNDYDTGAALVWWVPEVKVFVDNRLDPYSAKVIGASLNLSAKDYRQTFEEFSVRCALLPRGTPLVKTLRTDGWNPMYDDEQLVLLSR